MAVGNLEVCTRDRPVIGWRYWQLDVGPRSLLRSLSQRGFVWPPGRELVARCADGAVRAAVALDGRAHHAPEAGCGCGIHASADLASLQAQVLCLRPVALVVGEIALWGRVITEERADRAGRDHRGQFAYPNRLWVVRETLGGTTEAEATEGLATYGVAVGTMALDDAVGEASGMILRHLSMSTATTT